MHGDGATLLLMAPGVGRRRRRLPIRGALHGAIGDGFGLAFGRDDVRNQNGLLRRRG